MQDYISDMMCSSIMKRFRFATGIARPKTTALFFDKLWAPNDIRRGFYGQTFGLDLIPDTIIMDEEDLPYDKRERYVAAEELMVASLFRYSLMDTYEFDTYEKELPNLYECFNSGFEGGITENYKAGDFTRMRRSQNRNNGLLSCTLALKEDLGIDIVPIYIDKTRFEKECLQTSSYIEVLSENVIEMVIKSIPIAVEDHLSWDQVLDFRQDDESKLKMRRFLSWASDEMKGKSKDEVQESIGTALDDYRFALKKHGIETISSGITTILTLTETAIQAMNDINSITIPLGITISAGLTQFAVSSFVNYKDIKRRPIAYIYDIVNLAEKDY